MPAIAPGFRGLRPQPAAVLLDIDHPSSEIFTYNVDQAATLASAGALVAPKDRALLDAAQQSGRPVSVSVQGAWRRDVPGRNVVARLDRGSRQRTVACDFDAGDELVHQQLRARAGHRGLPGHGRLATEKRWPDADLVFVATSGHEIGHGGMEHFLHDGAPRPEPRWRGRISAPRWPAAIPW